MIHAFGIDHLVYKCRSGCVCAHCSPLFMSDSFFYKFIKFIVVESEQKVIGQNV